MLGTRNSSNAVAAGETVRWSGAAPTGWKLRAPDFFLIPFSLIWGVGLLSVAIQGVEAPSTVGWSALFLVPIVLVVAYLFAGRFMIDAYLRSRTTYIVTDRAAYIDRAGRLPAMRRYGRTAIDSMQLKVRRNGRGSIEFVSASSMRWFRNGGFGFWVGASLDGFEEIPDVRRVTNY